ncbi:MAG: hypothetical protein ACREEM_24975 [Blastocatellia bacterium]
MITKRIFWALMITGMMMISTTAVKAQWINREALMKAIQAGEAIQATTPQDQSNGIPAAVAQAASRLTDQEPTHAAQGGLLGILERQKKALVGAWLADVTPFGPNAIPPRKIVETFHEGGTHVVSAQREILPPPCTPGYGVWKHNGGRTFAATAISICYNLDGSLFGIFKVSRTITLNESSDQFDGEAKLVLTGPAGNVLFTGQATTRGVRVRVEALD